MSGIVYIILGVAVLELFRRGYLTNVIGGFTAAAKGESGPASLYSQPSRPFTLPGTDAQASLGGGGGRQS